MTSIVLRMKLVVPIISIAICLIIFSGCVSRQISLITMYEEDPVEKKIVELGMKHANEDFNSTKWFSVGCAGGTLSDCGTCLLPDSLAILPYTTAILSLVFVGSEVRVPETRLETIKNPRGLSIDNTLSDEEVSLYTRAYREETRRLRSKLARNGGVAGCVSSVVSVVIPILFLISLIGSLPSGEWNL